MTMKISVSGLVLVLGLAVMSGCASTATQRADSPSMEASTSPPTGTSTSKADAEDSEPITNTLKWSTASEVDNFGFDIYRSTLEEGPFERITGTPIEGAGTVDAPQYYEYIDGDIEPTQDYYYYVESISIDGVRERFSPIIKAPAKRPVDGAATEGSEAKP